MRWTHRDGTYNWFKDRPMSVAQFGDKDGDCLMYWPDVEPGTTVCKHGIPTSSKCEGCAA